MKMWRVDPAKKTVVFVVIFIILSSFICGNAFAQSYDEQVLNDAAEQIKVRGTNFDFKKQTEDFITGQGMEDAEGFFSKIINLLLSAIRENIHLLTKMAALCIVSGILSVVVEKEASSVSFLACLILITTMAVTVFKNVLVMAEQTIDNLMIFMQSLLPVVSALSTGAALGMLNGFNSALFVSMQIIIYACREWFLPMTLFVSVLSVINSMTTHFHITKLLETCRLFIKWGLGFLMTIYISFLSIYGFGQAAAAGAVSKTVKYALCAFLPMVGNVLSQSAETVMSGLSLIKNAIGITGVLAIFAIVLQPLFNILATSIIFRLSASVCEPATDKRVTKVISDLATNVSLVFSILLMVCVMFVISISMLLALTNILSIAR